MRCWLSVVTQVRVELVVEFVSRSAAAGSSRIAGLNHEIGDDAMEFDPIVELFVGQVDEVLRGARNLIGEKLKADQAAIRANIGDFHFKTSLNG